RNPYPAQTHVPSREWLAVLLYLCFRTSLPVRQTQHSRLPLFLSPLRAPRNRQPAARTPVLSPHVRNMRPCRPPMLIANLRLPFCRRNWPPAVPFRARHSDSRQVHRELGQDESPDPLRALL